MTISLVAIDYSRPILPMFELPPRVGIIHSVFRRAMNIALDNILVSVLSTDLPGMQKNVRLPSDLSEWLLRDLADQSENSGLAQLLGSLLSLDVTPHDDIAATIAIVARAWTTVLSAVLLGYAVRGEMAEHLGKLLQTLSLPSEESGTELEAAQQVLTFGSTSSGDILLSELLGLRAVEDN